MLPAPWNPDQINPSLMTSKEYQSFCNKNNEWHPDSAYDWSLEQMNGDYKDSDKSTFQKIRTFKVKGIDFDLVYKTEKLEYPQRNLGANSDTDPYLRVDGKILYYNDAEIKRLGYQPVGFTFAIFAGNEKVASAQDEWGCMLIAVANEYRAFGLGTIIGKIARTYEPGKTSGGFTSAGARNFARVHREFVRDALSSGLYSGMVRSGQMTVERVKAIVTSAKIQMRPAKDDVDLSSNSPKDWLLFTDFNGTFILYDRKLAAVIDQEEKYDAMFIEKMIKGMVYAMPHESAGVTRIKQFGGDAPGIKAFMLGLAYTRAKIENLPLVVEPEEYDLKGFEYGEENKAAGYSSKEVTNGKIIDYREMVDEEIRFRRRFDQYGEFKDRLMEMAHGKYQMVAAPKLDRWGNPTR